MTTFLFLRIGNMSCFNADVAKAKKSGPFEYRVRYVHNKYVWAYEFTNTEMADRFATKLADYVVDRMVMS
jgi:hypothetical protein